MRSRYIYIVTENYSEDVAYFTDLKEARYYMREWYVEGEAIQIYRVSSNKYNPEKRLIAKAPFED